MLSNITSNFLVQEAAACSLKTPGAFPVTSFCSPPPSPWNMLPTILPSTRTNFPCLQAYLTCPFCRKLLLALPVRCNLFFFESSILVCSMTCSNSAFLLQLGLYFLIFITLRLLFTSWQCWQQCLALDKYLLDHSLIL